MITRTTANQLQEVGWDLDTERKWTWQYTKPVTKLELQEILEVSNIKEIVPDVYWSKGIWAPDLKDLWEALPSTINNGMFERCFIGKSGAGYINAKTGDFIVEFHMLFIEESAAALWMWARIRNKKEP